MRSSCSSKIFTRAFVAAWLRMAGVPRLARIGPRLSNLWTTLWYPYRLATNSGNIPSCFVATLTWASLFLLSNAIAILGCLYWRAINNGDAPLMEGSCLAPNLSNVLVANKCPFSTAACNAVAPFPISVFFCWYAYLARFEPYACSSL